MENMRATEHTRDELQDLLAAAEYNMSRLNEILTEGDLDEKQFKDAVTGAMRMAIVKAAITSMSVMRGTA